MDFMNSLFFFHVSHLCCWNSWEFIIKLKCEVAYLSTPLFPLLNYIYTRSLKTRAHQTFPSWKTRLISNQIIYLFQSIVNFEWKINWKVLGTMRIKAWNSSLGIEFWNVDQHLFKFSFLPLHAIARFSDHLL